VGRWGVWSRIQTTPQVALAVNYPTLVNSEYVNAAATAKNCYLIYVADECENVLYSEILLHNKDSMDATILEKSELCYQVVNCGNSYQLFYSEDCDGCQNVYFSKDCIGCSNCFGCKGLRNKQYYIFNEPCEKEDYQKKIGELGFDSFRNIESLKSRVYEFWQTQPHKFAHVLRNTNTTGDYVYGSKNSKNMYVVSEGTENSRYCQLLSMPGTKDSYDYTMWGNVAQRIYECVVVGEGADNVKFSYQAWPDVRDIEYSLWVISSAHLFGCANIRKKQYCILNKQYTKDEYEKLKKRIVQDMGARPYIDIKGRVYKYGEFLPAELSLFGYNESYAIDFFPLDRESAKVQGFSWYDAEPLPYKQTLSANDLPDSIKDVKDSILQEIIGCKTCNKPFRLVVAELSLLRRFGLPLPRNCPNCRYQERLSHINSPRLYKRDCECAGIGSRNDVYSNVATHFHQNKPCPNKFETSYSPERKEIVYCEQCYNAEVV
jgi:hypothetical protein